MVIFCGMLGRFAVLPQSSKVVAASSTSAALIATSTRHGKIRQAGQVSLHSRCFYQTTQLWLSSRSNNPDEQDSLASTPTTAKAAQKDPFKLPRFYVGPDPRFFDWSTEKDAILWEAHSPSSPSSDSLLHPQQHILLSEGVVHHLTTVLRLRQGSHSIRLFDGHGDEYLAAVDLTTTPKKRRRNAPPLDLQAVCLESLVAQTFADQDYPILLCAAQPNKKDRLRWLVEKSTELGVRDILWMQSDYSQAPMLDKVLTYATDASQQCERRVLPRQWQRDASVENQAQILKQQHQPESQQLIPLEQLLDDCPLPMLVCRERKEGATTLWSALQRHESGKPVVLLVGPEGGWSPSEHALFDRHPRVTSVSLGSTILRAETAVLTALAGIRLWMDERS